MRPLLNLETLWTQALGGVPAPHLREGCDPHGDRGQCPDTSVAQELMSIPCAACLRLALRVSAGRALDYRALGSRSEQRLHECLFIQACRAGIGCCRDRSPRPPSRETLDDTPRDGADGERGLSVKQGLWDSDRSDRGHWLIGQRNRVCRCPKPASRMYVGHLGCGVAPGPHEDHGQGRGDA